MNVTKERIAELAHEINRVYCEWLGDNTQERWDNAPEWARRSAINGVEFHLGGERLPIDSHDSWMAEKLREGWKYGPVKDADKKEHPCIVPYCMLPVEQQVKDYLFTFVVRAMSEFLPKIKES